MNRSPRRYLILLPRQLGDILLGTTLSTALKSQDPNAQIWWYCHPMGLKLLERNPHLEGVLAYPLPPKQGGMRARLAYFWQEMSFVLKLRKMKFDVAIDAMNNPRTALTAWLARAPVRISFRTRWPRNYAFTHLLDRSEMDKGYLGAARLRLLRPLGMEPANVDAAATTVLASTPLEQEKVAQYFANVLAHTSALHAVLLSPTHRHAVRRWPGDLFVDFAEKWICEFRQPVIWLWGPGELEFIQSLHFSLQKRLQEKGIADHFSQVPPLFSLRETAALSGLAQAWVGNSNGLSHVAVAGGAKTIQLHGPTRPESWTPAQRENHRGLQRSEGCVECGKNECALARRECLLDLSVSSVFDQALDLFKPRRVLDALD